MRYAVVNFTKSKIRNEVPESWIVKESDNTYSCWWSKNALRVTYLLKNPELQKPNLQEFELHDIETPAQYYDNYKKARSKANDSTYTSDENKKGRGKRLKKKNNRYISESESDSEDRDEPISTLDTDENDEDFSEDGQEENNDTEVKAKKTNVKLKNKSKTFKESLQNEKNNDSQSQLQTSTKVPLPQPAVTSKMTITRKSSLSHQIPSTSSNSNMSTHIVSTVKEDYISVERDVFDNQEITDNETKDVDKINSMQKKNKVAECEEKGVEGNSDFRSNLRSSFENTQEDAEIGNGITNQTFDDAVGSSDVTVDENMHINCEYEDIDSEEDQILTKTNTLKRRNNDTDSADVLGATLAMCSRISIQVRNFNNRIQKLEKTAYLHKKKQDIIHNFLPLKSVNDIISWETELKKNNEVQIEFEHKIRKIGGGNSANHVKEVLRDIFTHECTALCTWKGKSENNFKIENLHTTTILQDCLCEIYPAMTHKEFKGIVQVWFKYAKQRLQRKRDIEAGVTSSHRRKVNETPASLKKLLLPKSAITNFLLKARENSLNEIETCGFLCGKVEPRKFKITHLIVPQQTGTANTCTATNEEEVLHYQTENGLMTLGWIHTHPTQDSFISSVDLHTHFGYQKQLPESIAVVCSIKTKNTDIFRLTETGTDAIQQCQQSGFHDHAGIATSIYQPAKHVIIDEDSFITAIDLRYT